jgi:predicted DNA binding CopG/RHH family protein
MKKTPEIGRYFDLGEKAFAQDLETGDAPLKSGLTPERKNEIEAMARATMADERAKISLGIPKRDLARLKSRALQEGIPYQTQCADPSIRVGLRSPITSCSPGAKPHGATPIGTLQTVARPKHQRRRLQGPPQRK